MSDTLKIDLCPKCGKIFHVETSPSRAGDRCDECDTPLLQRKDDTVEVVRQRLEVYHAETKPLIRYYRERGAYVEIHGEGSVDDIYASLQRTVRENTQGMPPQGD